MEEGAMLFVYVFLALLIGTGLYVTGHEMHATERHSAWKLVSRVLNTFLWAFLMIGTMFHMLAIASNNVILIETVVLLAVAYLAVYAGFLMCKKSLFWLY
jgi:hypothetical protein